MKLLSVLISSVNDWITNTENKLKQFTEVVEKLSEEDSIKFGRKDPEAYPLLRCTCMCALNAHQH